MTSNASAADRGSFSDRFRRAGGPTLLINVLATVAAIAATADRALGATTLLLALVVLIVVEWRLKSSPAQLLASHVLARVLLIAAISAPIVSGDHRLLIAAVVLGIATILEPVLKRTLLGAIPYAANLPGVDTRNDALARPTAVFAMNALGILLLAAEEFLVLDAAVISGAVTLLALASMAFSGVLAVDAVRRIRARRIADRHLNDAIAAYAPTFAVHWDAAHNTGYQLGMWLPYLERIGEPFIVVIRNQATFAEVLELTDRPVLLRKTHQDLDDMIVPSLRAAFYVNNAVKNSQFVRFSELWHIQLNHGESDKAPSYNPALRAYDRNFVAGQAAIDRFAAHGLSTAPDYFEIVGRPQLEMVEPATGGLPQSGATVLYAPTWAGFNADSAYSSLPVGTTIVYELLARGCRVLFRPHPHTYRSPELTAAADAVTELLRQDAERTGREHLYGAETSENRTLADCFNLADALVSDVSSVVPDFLVSGKPFAISTMLTSAEAFTDDYAIAAAGYVFEPDSASIRAALDDMLGADSKREQREAARVYYLGDETPATVVEHFVETARRILFEPKPQRIDADRSIHDVRE